MKNLINRRLFHLVGLLGLVVELTINLEDYCEYSEDSSVSRLCQMLDMRIHEMFEEDRKRLQCSDSTLPAPIAWGNSDIAMVILNLGAAAGYPEIVTLLAAHFNKTNSIGVLTWSSNEVVVVWAYPGRIAAPVKVGDRILYRKFEEVPQTVGAGV